MQSKFSFSLHCGAKAKTTFAKIPNRKLKVIQIALFPFLSIAMPINGPNIPHIILGIAVKYPD